MVILVIAALHMMNSFLYPSEIDLSFRFISLLLFIVYQKIFFIKTLKDAFATLSFTSRALRARVGLGRFCFKLKFGFRKLTGFGYLVYLMVWFSVFWFILWFVYRFYIWA